MKPAFTAPVLLFAAILSAQASQARNLGQSSHKNSHRMHLGDLDAAASRRPLSAMDLTPRMPLDRPYGEMFAAPAEDHIPTAVSYQMAPNGPVGTVGIVTLASSHALDPSLMSNAVANQRGAPSQTIGAALAYNFH